MNALQYFIKSIGARIGLTTPRHHLRVASEEALLLKEAETLVGKLTWKEVETIEELTAEYWRLRQLDGEEKTLKATLAKATERDKAVQAKVNKPETQITPKLEATRAKIEEMRNILAEQLRLLQEKLNQSEGIRKRFNGFKLKLTVLKSEGAEEYQLSEVRGRLAEIKKEYGELATEVEACRGSVAHTERVIEALEAEERNFLAQLSLYDRGLTREVAEVGRYIVEANTRLGIIDSERSEHYTAIGRFLCAPENAQKPEVRARLVNVAPVAARARSLARSISYNRSLADR